MKASLLVAYLNGGKSTYELRIQIKKSVESMRKLLDKKGASIAIEVDQDVDAFLILPSHIIKLCEDFSTNKLDGVEIDYIASAIELSECFCINSDRIEEAVAILSDSVSNGPLTKELALDIADSVEC